MEEYINDKVYGDNEKNNKEKQENETTGSESPTFGEGKGVIDERGGKDVDSDEFDASTCSGDRFMVFLINRKKSLLKVQFFWVDTNKTIW